MQDNEFALYEVSDFVLLCSPGPLARTKSRRNDDWRWRKWKCSI